MDSSLLWIILSGLGSMVIAIILGVAAFFTSRYIKHQDEKNRSYYISLDMLAKTVSEIKSLIENQSLRCDNKMLALTHKVEDIEDVTEDHEKRIGKVEAKVFNQ